MFDNDTLVRVHARNYEDLVWESERRSHFENQSLVPFKRRLRHAATRAVVPLQQVVCQIGLFQNTAVCPIEA